jgi:ribosomal protein S18 acetylase RimI-like enzyme
MITVSRYKSVDYPQVKSLLEEAGLYDGVWDSQVNLSGMIKTNPQSIVLAKDGKKVVGHILVVPFGIKVIFLFRFAVKKEYQRKGVGTMLLEHVYSIMKKKGVVESALFVDSENKELHEFYRKRGYSKSIKKYFSMWRSLD